MNTPSHLKPAFHLNVWYGHGVMCYNQVTPNEYLNLRNENVDRREYVLEGQNATIFVISHDMTLTRQDALKSATSFVRGWGVSTEVDLDKLTVKKWRDEPKINPPN